MNTKGTTPFSQSFEGRIGCQTPRTFAPSPPATYDDVPADLRHLGGGESAGGDMLDVERASAVHDATFRGVDHEGFIRRAVRE